MSSVMMKEEISVERLRSGILAEISTAADERELRSGAVAPSSAKGVISWMKELGSSIRRPGAPPALLTVKERVTEALAERRCLREAALEARHHRASRRPAASSKCWAASTRSTWTGRRRDLRRSRLRGRAYRDRLVYSARSTFRPGHPARQERYFLFPAQARWQPVGAAHPYVPCRSAAWSVGAADPDHRAGPHLSLRQRPHPYADVPSDRGLAIDRDLTLGHPKWCLEEFCGVLRARPGQDAVPGVAFPFTEPSMEVDINCSWEGGQIRIGTGDSWLEVLGSGMVHPNGAGRRARSRSVAGLPSAWARPHRDAEIWHPRPSRLLRGRSALASALQFQALDVPSLAGGLT